MNAPAFRSIAVIGTGALGGFYGARLAQTGFELHFLCHRDGPHIRAKGLVVESLGHSLIHLPARAYDCAADMPPCDLALVALKTTANHRLPELLPPALKPDGVVVVMQNGLEVERDAARAAPGHLVLGGLCFLCANKTGPGTIQHLDYGDVLLGWFEETGTRAQADARLQAIKDALLASRITADISPNLRLARWKKLVWNIPFNGLSVLHRTTTDVLMADARHRAHVETLMCEVQTLARADGHLIEDAFIRKMLDDTLKMKPYKTSMLLDFEAGRPLEIEAMYERPLRAGEKAGAAAPAIRDLWRRLSELHGQPQAAALQRPV